MEYLFRKYVYPIVGGVIFGLHRPWLLLVAAEPRQISIIEHAVSFDDNSYFCNSRSNRWPHYISEVKSGIFSLIFIIKIRYRSLTKVTFQPNSSWKTFSPNKIKATLIPKLNKTALKSIQSVQNIPLRRSKNLSNNSKIMSKRIL